MLVSVIDSFRENNLVKKYREVNNKCSKICILYIFQMSIQNTTGKDFLKL